MHACCTVVYACCKRAIAAYQSTDSMVFPSLSSAIALSWQRLGLSAAICVASAFLDIPMVYEVVPLRGNVTTCTTNTVVTTVWCGRGNSDDSRLHQLEHGIYVCCCTALIVQLPLLKSCHLWLYPIYTATLTRRTRRSSGSRFPCTRYVDTHM